MCIRDRAMMGAATMQQEIQMNTPVPTPPMATAEPVTAELMNSDDADDTMSYFAKLANEG